MGSPLDSSSDYNAKNNQTKAFVEKTIAWSEVLIRYIIGVILLWAFLSGAFKIWFGEPELFIYHLAASEVLKWLLILHVVVLITEISYMRNVYTLRKARYTDATLAIILVVIVWLQDEMGEILLKYSQGSTIIDDGKNLLQDIHYIWFPILLGGVFCLLFFRCWRFRSKQLFRKYDRI